MLQRIRRITLLNDSGIEKMKIAGQLAAQLLKELGAVVAPGITTEDLDQYAVQFAKKHGVVNAPLNYKGYPKSICTSVNDVVCHGIPSADRVLKEGDIVKIDVTLIVDRHYGDTCATFFVGTPSPEARALTQVTANSLRLALDVVKVGSRMGDIGAVIQQYATDEGYGVVKEFQGHGINTVFHTAPDVPHFGRKNTGERMRRGMSFTIEPMINIGDWKTTILDDDWTAITKDHSLSAQFEHTMIVDTDGPIITTFVEGDDPWKVSPGGVITYDL